jgi:resuscitation-promoting factor RpfB
MVISITASSRQYSEIRAVEAWLASHAASQPQPLKLVVSMPPPPLPLPPKPAPAQQVTPVAAASMPTPSGSAQQIAMAMLASYGWSSSQFGCLDPLWQRESGWNVFAANPDGAYGIPQADPGSKMATAGPDWQSDAATQITWGLNYIQATYGSPCAAWSHEEATGWY